MTQAKLLIYIPAAKALTADLEKQHNLRALFGSRSFREVQVGPAGPGLIIAPACVAPDLITYKQDQQRWSPRFGCNSWIGHWIDNKPNPESLKRPSILPGSPVTLLDGNPWIIPQIRMWQDADPPLAHIRLPRVVQQDPATGGLVLGNVVPTYQQVWERSLQVFSAVTGQHGKIDDESATMFALELLQINYWMDSSAISHLELLTVEHCGSVIRAALDIDSFEGILKNQLSRSV